MKREEIYDKHADRRKNQHPKSKKRNQIDWEERRSRVSFKNYIRKIRDKELEEELEDELNDDLNA
jgi:uncharacterized protein (DUF1919 family)